MPSEPDTTHTTKETDVAVKLDLMNFKTRGCERRKNFFEGALPSCPREGEGSFRLYFSFFSPTYLDILIYGVRKRNRRSAEAFSS